jgi:hypothetical protein
MLARTSRRSRWRRSPPARSAQGSRQEAQIAPNAATAAVGQCDDDRRDLAHSGMKTSRARIKHFMARKVDIDSIAMAREAHGAGQRTTSAVLGADALNERNAPVLQMGGPHGLGE